MVIDKELPLGLPKGSVRALIALGVVGTFLGMSVLGLPVPEALGVLAGAIGIYYFKQRENGG